MKRWRLLRRFRVGLGVLLALAVAGELTARYGLGLSDPPLSVAHPTIEYMFAPNQDRCRFGNRIYINRYGMRSADFPAEKTDPDEYRIMVLGDSVVNGGSLTDHENLATTMLQKQLAEEMDRPVVVANASAGSWGPPNLLAYTQTHGFFDADTVLIVLSSHDAADVPTFEPLNPATHPTHTPPLALWEGMTRYLPRYLPGAGAGAEPDSAESTDADAIGETASQTAPTDPQALDALRQLITDARAAGCRVILIQHWTRDELAADQPGPGHAAIAAIARAQGTPTYQTAQAFRAAIDRGQTPYRDHIHPSEAGQQALLEVFERAVSFEL